MLFRSLVGRLVGVSPEVLDLAVAQGLQRTPVGNLPEATCRDSGKVLQVTGKDLLQLTVHIDVRVQLVDRIAD